MLTERNFGELVCQYIVDIQNEKLASHEMRKVLPEHFPSWIELYIDFKKRLMPVLRIAQANPFGQQYYVANQDLEQNRIVNYDSTTEILCNNIIRDNQNDWEFS